MSGVGKYLKEQNPNIKVFAVEPFESSVINGYPSGVHSIDLLPLSLRRYCVKVFTALEQA